MLCSVFLPYLQEKLTDVVERANWSDPSNLRSSKLVDKLKYFIGAKLLPFINKLAKLFELVNFLAFMTKRKLVVRNQTYWFKRNLSETAL